MAISSSKSDKLAEQEKGIPDLALLLYMSVLQFIYVFIPKIYDFINTKHGLKCKI